MLPKAKRLSRVDFSRKPLRRKVFPFGSLVFYEAPGKAAVVISKKVAHRAAQRNNLRRRFYAALKKTKLNHSVVIFPNKSALTASFSEIKTALTRAVG